MIVMSLPAVLGRAWAGPGTSITPAKAVAPARSVATVRLPRWRPRCALEKVPGVAMKRLLSGLPVHQIGDESQTSHQ